MHYLGEAPFWNVLVLYMGIARLGWGEGGEEGYKRLPGWFGALFCPTPNGQYLVLGEVKTLVRMVCALFSSTWQCKKKTSNGTLSQTSELYIWCIYFLLEVCRPYVFISNVMASIWKEKDRVWKKAPHAARLMLWNTWAKLWHNLGTNYLWSTRGQLYGH